MRGLTFGLTREVEENYIDLDRMAKDGKIDRTIESSPNGYYPVVIVPEHLKGRMVLIIPLTDEDRPLRLQELKE